MPSGRDIHTIKPYTPPSLDASTLAAMRAPPSPNASLQVASGGGDDEGQDSSDDDRLSRAGTVVGAFPGTREEYAGTPAPGGSGGYY
jgi:hypothetical protein